MLSSHNSIQEFIPQNRRFLLALLSLFQPLGVVIACLIAYSFIPSYSCGNDAQGNALLSCHSKKLTPGEKCCTKASNMGWRYTTLCIGALCVVIFFLRFVVFRFQESPKFLLYRGKDEKAAKVLQHIAKFNGRQCNITLETFEALDRENDALARLDSTIPTTFAGTRDKTLPWSKKIIIELNRYKLLFVNLSMARLTLLVWITYAL